MEDGTVANITDAPAQIDISDLQAVTPSESECKLFLDEYDMYSDNIHPLGRISLEIGKSKRALPFVNISNFKPSTDFAFLHSIMKNSNLPMKEYWALNVVNKLNMGVTLSRDRKNKHYASSEGRRKRRTRYMDKS